MLNFLVKEEGKPEAAMDIWVILISQGWRKEPGDGAC